MKKKISISRKRGQLIRREKESPLQEKKRKHVAVKLTAKKAKANAEKRKRIMALFEEGINSTHKPTQSFFRKLKSLANKGLVVHAFEETVIPKKREKYKGPFYSYMWAFTVSGYLEKMLGMEGTIHKKARACAELDKSIEERTSNQRAFSIESELRHIHFPIKFLLDYNPEYPSKLAKEWEKFRRERSIS